MRQDQQVPVAPSLDGRGSVPSASDTSMPLQPLLGQMPAVIWAVDRDLRFTLSEGGGLGEIDTEPGKNVGRTLYEYFGTGDPEFAPIAAHRLALEGQPATFEIDWMGRTFHTRVEPLRSGEGEISGAIGLAIDITERRLAETELAQAEAKYRTLVEQIPAVVYIAEFGLTGQWLYLSPKLEEVLGYPPKEWTSEPDPLAGHLHPEDRERVLSEERRCQEQGVPFSCEYRVSTKDGRVVWIRDEAVPVPLTPELWQGVMLDVTSQKRAEEVLRSTIATLRETDEERRRLLSRLAQAREEEHRRIAAEVHDGPVQKMVAVGLRLQMLRRRLSDDEDQKFLGDLTRVVDESTRELRHLLFELVPPALEAGGLADALRALLDEFVEEEEPRVRLQDRLSVEPSESARITCFRITEEALRNVRKHATASSVEIMLENSGDGTHVKIKDDGCGFETNGSPSPGHAGLVGMRERAESAGGWLKIQSGVGAGTTVEFWLPQEVVPSA